MEALHASGASPPVADYFVTIKVTTPLRPFSEGDINKLDAQQQREWQQQQDEERAARGEGGEVATGATTTANMATTIESSGGKESPLLASHSRMGSRSSPTMMGAKKAPSPTNATVAEQQQQGKIKAPSSFLSRVDEDLSRALEPMLVDIGVFLPGEGEVVPHGFVGINKTPYKTSADLNLGVVSGGGVFLCVQFASSPGAKEKMPISDIILVYADREKCPEGYTFLESTVSGKSANLNRASQVRQVFLAFKRIPAVVDESERYHSCRTISDLCVLNSTKKQTPPLGYTLIEKSTTTGNWTGASMMLAYRLSSQIGMLDMTYSCTVVDRFPREERPEYPLPPMISLFTAPYGVKLERKLRTEVPLPKFFTFVLTTEFGEKVHGACLSFYEELPEEEETLLEESFDEHIRTLCEQLGDLNLPTSHLARINALRKEKGTSQAKTRGGSFMSLGSISGGSRSSSLIFSPTTKALPKKPSFFSKQSAKLLSPQHQQSGAVGSFTDDDISSPYSGTLNNEVDGVPVSDESGAKHKPHQRSIETIPDSTVARGEDPGSGVPTLVLDPARRRNSSQISLASLKVVPDVRPKILAPTSICILSHWPFYASFKQFLNLLYQVSLSPSTIPLETIIGNFISRTPSLTQGGPGILLKFGQASAASAPIAFSLPKEIGMPMCEADFETVFRHLNVEHFVHLYTLVLLERKILLHSRHRSLLNQVAECVRSLMFPLDWRSVYVPVCPENLLRIIEAPMSFLMGADSEWAARVPLPEGVWEVSIDDDRVECSTRLEAVEVDTGAKSVLVSSAKLAPAPSSSVSTLRRTLSGAGSTSSSSDSSSGGGSGPSPGSNPENSFLPAQIHKDLLERLNRAVNDHQIRVREIHEVNEDPDVAYTMAVRGNDQIDSSMHSFGDIVRDAGLNTMIALIGNYRQFLTLPTAKIGNADRIQFSGLFDVQGFLASAPKANRPFLEELVISQAFSSFIEECGAAYTKSQAYRLIFFDAAVQAVNVANEAKDAQKTALSLTPRPTSKLGFKGLRRPSRGSSPAPPSSTSSTASLFSPPLPPTLSPPTSANSSSGAGSASKESAILAASTVLQTHIATVSDSPTPPIGAAGSAGTTHGRRRSNASLVTSMLSRVGEKRKSGSQGVFTLESAIITDLVDSMFSVPPSVVFSPHLGAAASSVELSKQASSSSDAPATPVPSFSISSRMKRKTISTSSSSPQTSKWSGSSFEDDDLSQTDELIEFDVTRKPIFLEFNDYPYDLGEFQFDRGIYRYRSLSNLLPAGSSEAITQMMDSIPIERLKNIDEASTTYRYPCFPILRSELLGVFSDSAGAWTHPNSESSSRDETVKGANVPKNSGEEPITPGHLNMSNKSSWFKEETTVAAPQTVFLPPPALVSPAVKENETPIPKPRLARYRTSAGESSVPTPEQQHHHPPQQHQKLHVENEEANLPARRPRTGRRHIRSGSMDRPFISNPVFFGESDVRDGEGQSSAGSTSGGFFNTGGGNDRRSSISDLGFGKAGESKNAAPQEGKNEELFRLAAIASATASSSSTTTTRALIGKRSFFRWRSQLISSQKGEYTTQKRLSFSKSSDSSKDKQPTEPKTPVQSQSDGDNGGSGQSPAPFRSTGHTEDALGDSARTRNIENLNQVAWAAARTPEEVIQDTFSLRVSFEMRNRATSRWILELMSHLLGAWFVCIPTFIAASDLPQVALLQAFTVFRKSLDQELTVNEAGYRSLIISCGNCGPLYAYDAERLLQDFMTRKNTKPNSVTFTQFTRSVTRALVDFRPLLQLRLGGPYLDASKLATRRVRALRRIVMLRSMGQVFIALFRLYRTVLLNSAVPENVDDGSGEVSSRSDPNEDDEDDENAENVNEEMEDALTIDPKSSSLSPQRLPPLKKSQSSSLSTSSAMLAAVRRIKSNSRGSVLSNDTVEGNGEEPPTGDEEASVLGAGHLPSFSVKGTILSKPGPAMIKKHAMCPSEGDAILDANRIPHADCVVIIFSMNICPNCKHELLDEEIMASWAAEFVSVSDSPSAMPCTMCSEFIYPKLRFQVLGKKPGYYGTISGDKVTYGEVEYMNLPMIRYKVEEILLRHGPVGLYRESMREQYPTIYWNLIWFINRVKLPIPLYGGSFDGSPSSLDLSGATTSSDALGRKYAIEAVMVGWDGHVLAQEAARLYGLGASEGDTSDDFDLCRFPRSECGRSQFVQGHEDLSRGNYENVHLSAYEPMQRLWGNQEVLEDLIYLEGLRMTKHLEENIPLTPSSNSVHLGPASTPISILALIFSFILYKKLDDAIIVFLQARLASGDGTLEGWEVFGRSLYRELWVISRCRVEGMDSSQCYSPTQFDSAFSHALKKLTFVDNRLANCVCPGDYPPGSFALAFRRVFGACYP